MADLLAARQVATSTPPSGGGRTTQHAGRKAGQSLESTRLAASAMSGF